MEETIKILTDITKKDVEKSLSMDEEILRNVNAHYSQRYGWHLRRTVEFESNCWQDDTQ